MSGGELFDRIADENYEMTESEVIMYMRQILSGLKHMHENNIVHLDIKVVLIAHERLLVNEFQVYLYLKKHMNNCFSLRIFCARQARQHISRSSTSGYQLV